MEPLEWLARMSDHLPEPGQHRTLFYGEYANRLRGRRGPAEPEALPAEPPRKRCSPSWARLIAKVYEVDPLVCTRCGKRMSIVAFVSDAFAIRRILDHLGLSTPEAEKPPPRTREVRVSLSTARAGACRHTGSDPNPSLAASVASSACVPPPPGSRRSGAGALVAPPSPEPLGVPRQARFPSPRPLAPHAATLADQTIYGLWTYGPTKRVLACLRLESPQDRTKAG